MRQPLFLLFPALCAAVVPASAFAQMSVMPACAAPADPPAEMASWRAPQPMKAAADAKGAGKVKLKAGQAAALTLLPTPRISYPLRPAKPGGSVSFGGIVHFTVDQSGTWRVALSSGAWVDVVKDGTAATSTAHGHGPDCTGIRKMVDYSLEPGDYILQLAANGDPQMTVLVTRLP
ncbi:MAG: hypothetical protein AABZ76_03045 [Pseudomonadota bacterium]|uniref:hypothetical protein n=1 Tax=Sphingobium yanoikuyae TaxID=13690 RepID=UPI0013790C47|nr:hypothetical protein [Sphingobium yanoikuyae]